MDEIIRSGHISGEGLERPHGPPYRSPTGYYMGSLFYERILTRPIGERPILPVFSLMDDREGLINCRKTFIEENDDTGYRWAMKYLGDWHHFLKLSDTIWFRSALDIWKEELKTKQITEALDTIRSIASQEAHKGQLQAAKYLAGREWEKPAKSRGRPSKQEIAGELKTAIRNLEDEEADLQRITKN